MPQNGECADLIRSRDWSQTAIGPLARWPPSLRTAISICLDSRYPILLWWGSKMLMLYNDAYRAILGAKHPASFGSPGEKVWPEIWNVIGPMLHGVIDEGQATWSDDLELVLHRNGYFEETYFTFSYSPIRDSAGTVEGIFSAIFETTDRVFDKRRLRTLRDLAARSLEKARSVEEACRIDAATLGENDRDVPFALIYLTDSERKVARLAGSAGVIGDSRYAPAEVVLDDPAQVWPMGAQMTGASFVDTGAFADLPAGAWDEPPHSVAILPLQTPGHESHIGFLVAGVSPRRQLDERYLNFLTTAAGHIANAIASARAYEDERARAEALAKVDRAKTLFFTNISHEFRTPLTLMLGPVEDLLAKPAEQIGPESRQNLEIIHRHGLRLLKLVNTLLDFSRIESGRMRPNYEPTNLSKFTAELASTFRSAIEKAGIRFAIDTPPIETPVYVDPDMWEKIVLNLLSNAFKFTFDGEISVRLRETHGAVELAISDTGVGIPVGELPQLFARFHRVEGSRGRSYEGTGIGLALVKELVQLHSGAVLVESVEGQGTTFRVTLPTNVSRSTAAGPLPLRSAGNLQRQYVEELQGWVAEDGDVTITTAPSEKPRVVLADDNADMRQYIARLLEPRFEVHSAPNGRSALNLIRRHPPDLVVTDVMMPELDGFGLLREMRADPALQSLPVIMLSARAGEEARIEGVQAGADDYVIKPFSARELLARISAQVDMLHIRRDAQRRITESEERLQLAMKFAALGSWEFDPATGAGIASERVRAIFGCQSNEAPVGFWFSRMHPDDRPRVEALFQSAVATVGPYEAEYRVVDGETTRWIRSKGHMIGGERPRMIGIIEDITERKASEARADALYQEATEAHRTKDDFFAMLSHELRTPLTSISGWASLLEHNPDPDTALAAARSIGNSAGLQAKLVDDLLDVSRMMTGKFAMEKSEIDLRTVIDSAVAAARPAAAAKAVALRLTSPASIAFRGDEARLRQVTTNLLSNAIKFTPAGGVVLVRLDIVDSSVLLEVTDTGEGIDPLFLPRVFERYAQAGGRRYGGLGLGLSIARHIVELHGGSVAVKSEGEGKGATFFVRLPLSNPAADSP